MSAFDELPPNAQTIEPDLLDASDPFGFREAPQLPAAPKADTFSHYLMIGLQARNAGAKLRGDDVALQNAAKRVGSLCGEDGFYSFPIAGGRVEGPSVRLAKALANKYGFVAFGVEIDRIVGDQVFLTGVCLDLLSFVAVRRGYVFTLSPPPAKFAAKADQRARWEAMQVQSAGAKALRGAILDCLPSWFVAPAFEAAKASAGSRVLREGETIESARASALQHFAGMGVTREELEALIATPMIEWDVSAIADLRQLARALKAKETTIDEVFQAVRGQPRAQPAASGPHEALGLGKQRKPRAPKKEPEANGEVAARAGDRGGAPLAPETAPAATAHTPSAAASEVARLVDAVRAAEADAGEGAVSSARAQVEHMPMSWSADEVVDHLSDEQVQSYIAALSARGA